VARVRVVGLGSGGRTAVDHLIGAGLEGVDLLTVDTDATALRGSRAPLHIRLGYGPEGTGGTACSLERGRRAALASTDVLHNALCGSDVVFLLAGLGGGTGTGAAPIVAQVAREQGALVIAIVTYPFTFEDPKRLATAEEGVKALRNCTDTLIVIPNDRLLSLAAGNFGFHETYRLAHQVWHQSIQGLSDLINRPGLINVDFADVRTIMSEGGAAVIASGRGWGPGRARLAAEQATHSELLGITIDGAHGLLLNVAGGPNMSLHEVREAAALITACAHPEANVIFGAVIDPALEDELRITVIATGFGVSRLLPSAGRARIAVPRPQPAARLAYAAPA
jgi:cell division protein FtsZ